MSVLLSCLVLAGCSGDDDPGPVEAPPIGVLRDDMTPASAASLGWADCRLRPPDPPSMAVGEMHGDPDFFDGSGATGDELVPSGAFSVALCSIGAQSGEAWLLKGPMVEEIVEALNNAPEKLGAGGCTSDYGVPQRVVFHYKDDVRVPLSWSSGGCGSAWNGERERVNVGLLVGNVQEAMARTGHKDSQFNQTATRPEAISMELVIRRFGSQRFRTYTGPTPPPISEVEALQLPDVEPGDYVLGLRDVGLVRMDDSVTDWTPVWVIAGEQYVDDVNASCLGTSCPNRKQPGWVRYAFFFDARTGDPILSGSI